MSRVIMKRTIDTVERAIKSPPLDGSDMSFIGLSPKQSHRYRSNFMPIFFIVIVLSIFSCKSETKSKTVIEEKTPSPIGASIPISSPAQKANISIPVGYDLEKELAGNLDDEPGDELLLILRTDKKVPGNDLNLEFFEREARIYKRTKDQWNQVFIQSGGWLRPFNNSSVELNGLRDISIGNGEIEVVHSEGEMNNRKYYLNTYALQDSQLILVKSKAKSYLKKEESIEEIKTHYWEKESPEILTTVEIKGSAESDFYKKTMASDLTNSQAFFNLIDVNNESKIQEKNKILFDIFLQLPRELSFGDISLKSVLIDRNVRGIKDIDINKDIWYSIQKADHKNGYLEITGAFEGKWQMTYWNLPRAKLVAVAKTECGPLCRMEYFKFFEYDGLKMEEVSRPEFASIFYTDFFNLSPQEYEKIQSQYDVPVSILFELPQSGKNIMATLFVLDAMDKDYLKALKPKLKSNKIPFIYADGKFVKGLPE